MLRFITPKRFAVVLICAIGLSWLAAAPVQASSEIREKMGRLAEEILKVTKGEAVTVGVFSPTGLPQTNSGPGLEVTLREELEKQSKGSVKDNAKFEIKGDYAYAKTHDPKLADLKVIKLTVELIDKEFAEKLLQVPLQVVLDATSSVGQILQLTASLPNSGTKEERNRKLKDLLENPSVFIDPQHPSFIKSCPESPYAVEILAKPLKDFSAQTAKPLMGSKEGTSGLAFVNIPRDDVYEVKIHNNSGKEVAVSLTIDGIDVYHFSDERKEDGSPRFSHLIVFPKGHTEPGSNFNFDGTATFQGWHKSLGGKNNVLSFLVTAYGKGAASQSGLAARGKVGVIQISFARSQPLPSGTAPRSGNETGFGPPRTVAQRALVREIEPPDEFVSIRYSR